ncbi:MAG: phosphatase PAP2 family protein [Ruminococcaceae bacterium]|nr:phosphatase PAP2 family protein [Oscillospiraceae bacterium]
MRTPVVDYRKLRLSNLTSPEFSHLLYLIYWPVFGIFFFIVERVYKPGYYYPMYSQLDDYIPFCEVFVIPYIFWFVFIAGMILYTAFYDISTFKRFMMYIIITYSVTLIIYFLFPNCQELRPIVFERDNFLTRFMSGYYQFDTNTNVCPSIHVIGSLAVMSAGLYIEKFKSPKWKIAFIVTAVLISVSTVFLKQHSIIDLFAALPLCAAAHFICFTEKKSIPKLKKKISEVQ